MSDHAIVVLLDTADTQLTSAGLELLTLANSLGEPVPVSFTEPSEATLAQLREYGVTRTYVVDFPAEASSCVAPVAAEGVQAVVNEVQGRVVLASPTFQNKEIAARAAYLLGAGLVIDTVTVGFEGDAFVGYKRVFAGSWDVNCTVVTDVAVATVRANAVVPTPVDVPSSHVDVQRLTVVPSATASSTVLVSRTVHPAIHGGVNRPRLAEAAYVVAGGRGTNGDFSHVEELADALGGAVGATRDAVDEGWIEHDAQIGQTGVTVAPRVYIGAGISGAPHHRGGMQASGVVIAVNSDPDCPLFDISDFAIVGELQDVLPQAAAAIREYKAAQ
ncbi:electron transfer flavoprotein subunit alpha/FixB family protein [Jonesia denitrificans]|uniref:Electron transfer flavoprotein alpha subunit n=1 Tax=Jonesia denitrificans (strain ATCC 14870 / DSM 20603 / BCRC 15368 / CIP 55.134 / JCM 11481 / NBRC 15587 / NCTC 10816 / Prevot 55134) TaxID=471856 RepID=C7QYY1_JONDD|nr:electron transfer flavoprotein subunit alpha/FixB family protein [Jonesia denitrificans]ACV09370.1 Electron transfer flavoprotein alpha subunit [Jonesia denitrificans DSM 20603]ASE09380.1 electron transfer flavoprotein subunit alpha/FixB family protein [Jonesia denitrificans]QXB43924.1 electron transfer flavoprotein subunit alpha/FixB family protein [Jonesia denitrificans]SQH21654.1 Electron transfer flavoprotein large subunit [Jonesia denitrificans]